MCERVWTHAAAAYANIQAARACTLDGQPNGAAAQNL